MDPSSAQLHQEMATDQTLESMLVCSKTQQEKKPRPQPEEALKCPRCDSTNTKFCYYNNYSLTQPRYFCKSCRRYWTKGGTLRNVPVGGGCRRNKRSPSSSSSSSSSKRSQDQPLITNNLHSPDLSPLPGLNYDPNDLSLAFARLQKQPTGQLGFDDHHHDLNSMGVFGYPNVQTMSSAPNGFHNLYYGMGNGNMGHVENGGLSVNASEEMAMPYEETSMAVTAMKQEFCNGGREGENRVLWGFPWQLGGDGNMGDLDSSGRESWNGSIGSSWHGLLNSPLT